MWCLSLSFALGKREPCGCKHGHLQVLPGPHFLLDLSFLPRVKCMPKPQFLLLNSWVPLLPLKTAPVSSGPDSVQKLTLSWVFKRRLLAPGLFFFFSWKSHCKKCLIFFPNFLSAVACSFCANSWGSCLQESLFRPRQLGPPLWLGQSLILPVLLLALCY